MNAECFIATTGTGLARVQRVQDDRWSVDLLSEPRHVTCLIADPCDESVIYAGTRHNGIFRSSDRGETWECLGPHNQTVKSIAISKARPQTIYAGTKPPGLYVSHDTGQHWAELESFGNLRRWFWFTPAEPGDPYVMGLTVSPTDPNVIVAGIEYGAMFRSADGGLTWHGHLKNTSRDCHAVSFHPADGNWVYQAGGGWPAAVSSDGGKTWRQPRKGMGWSFYGMACAADPQNPEIWYVSAAPHAVLPDLRKMPRGHWDGAANAFIFRRTKNGGWKRLGGGLPQPLSHMAYALVTDRKLPGHLYAGLSNGDVWFSDDYGDHWRQLPLNLTKIQYSLVKL